MNVVELNQRISVLYSAFILKLKNKNVKETKFWFDFSKKNQNANLDINYIAV